MTDFYFIYLLLNRLQKLCKLIWTGCLLVSACDAGKPLLNIRDLMTFCQCRDTLEIAVASAMICHIKNLITEKLEFYSVGTYAFCLCCDVSHPAVECILNYFHICLFISAKIIRIRKCDIDEINLTEAQEGKVGSGAKVCV